MKHTLSLESIYRRYHAPVHLGLDPLSFVRGFSDSGEAEIAGLSAAVLAYGRVEQIRKSLDGLLTRTGGGLARFTRSTPYAAKRAAFKGFRHRFNDGTDAALLFECTRLILERHGGIGAFFAGLVGPGDRDVGPGLNAFSTAFRKLALSIEGRRRPTFEYLFPSPESGSACKRLCMYLRWMVRKDDGIDLGLWPEVSPALLMVPVDTHVARVARELRLVRRKIPDWKMAEALTRRLKREDPADPTRFDFSLCTYGKLLFRARGRRGSKTERSNGGGSPWISADNARAESGASAMPDL